MAKTDGSSSSSSSTSSFVAGLTSPGFLYCVLLAFQFGLQPMIATRFTGSSVSRTSVVIGTELGKIIIAFISIMTEPLEAQRKVLEGWTLADSLKVAALPATLYAIQNLFVQYGYVLLDSMTFNLLNQTKTLSAAFWLFIIMGQKQSYVQIFALMLLLAAAYILNSDAGAAAAGGRADLASYHFGIMMVCGASMISGLSAALTQRALVGARPRHPLFFSAELAVYGIAFLLLNALFNPNSNEKDLILSGGLFSGWSLMTLIPVVTNAFGGLVVGLVTKYAGGVVKGFALIAGLIITGFAQWLFENKALQPKDWVACALVALSIYLHGSFPIRKGSTPSSAAKKDA